MGGEDDTVYRYFNTNQRRVYISTRRGDLNTAE